MVGTLDALRAMLAEGRFHHATHRHSGPRMWHGLYVYENDNPNGARFFERYKLAMVFYDDGPDIEEAYNLTRHNSCVGSYTNGA